MFIGETLRRSVQKTSTNRAMGEKRFQNDGDQAVNGITSGSQINQSTTEATRKKK